MEEQAVHSKKKTTAVDMTAGPIVKLMILYALPMLFGNLFQILYNTVDVLVVGNFVGTEALAAVGSTTSITYMAVLFFNGVSLGGGVVISQHFGAHDLQKLHRSVETTMAMTFLLSAVITVAAVLTVPAMLRLMSTPDDVMGPATTYLRIYFAGISGLLIYNMGSGILRAVGDTTRPLLFLIFTSILNIILDLVFVVGLHAGIAGVAYATILSQFVSALLVLVLLTRTRDIYRLTWKDMSIDRDILAHILSVGLPTGMQYIITAFSNVFVQGYINSFGSACMAGWSCYTKMDQFVFLPVQSMAQSATTFVSQNIGAKQGERANAGTRTAVGLSVAITALTATVLFVFARFAVSMFTRDAEVVRYGIMFMRLNAYFMIMNTVNQVLAGALRGRGDAKGPMYIMILNFVVVRQIYLFITSRVWNTAAAIGFGYPVGWTACCVVELTYYFIRWHGKTAK